MHQMGWTENANLGTASPATTAALAEAINDQGPRRRVGLISNDMQTARTGPMPIAHC
jgi:hypothetical protein